LCSYTEHITDCHSRFALICLKQMRHFFQHCRTSLNTPLLVEAGIFGKSLQIHDNAVGGCVPLFDQGILSPCVLGSYGLLIYVI